MQEKKNQTQQDKYTVCLAINDKSYQAEGDTIEEALLQLEPENYKTAGVFTIMLGDKKREQYFNIHKTRSLFEKKMFRDFMIKILLIPK
jgi:hypothetical protein|tara:strand:+ start:446 stop:712 length:267 start_codon:yes stop_codon:yes gene_type:complete